MNNQFLVGILAGLLSALFASPLIIADAMPASIFIYFSPLPILVVSLCFRHQAGLVATLVSALLLLLPSMSLVAGLFMLLGIGLPAWALAYLLLLGRRTENGMEWYPLGRLLFWISGMSALLTAIFILTFSGGSYEQYMTYVQAFLNLMEPKLKELLGASYDREMFVSFARAFIPSSQGSWLTLVLVCNLWLAARISTKSQNMPRPWSFIPAMRMPPAIIGFAFVSSALAFMDGFPGLIGLGMRAASYTALLLQGLAFIHFVTWGRPHRTPVLMIVYIALPLTLMIGQGFLLYGFIGFGAADVLFNIRNRFGANGSPPDNTTDKSF